MAILIPFCCCHQKVGAEGMLSFEKLNGWDRFLSSRGVSNRFFKNLEHSLSHLVY